MNHCILSALKIDIRLHEYLYNNKHNLSKHEIEEISSFERLFEIKGFEPPTFHKLDGADVPISDNVYDKLR